MNRVDNINRGMEEVRALAGVEIPSLEGKDSEEEWAVRVDRHRRQVVGELVPQDGRLADRRGQQLGHLSDQLGQLDGGGAAIIVTSGIVT